MEDKQHSWMWQRRPSQCDMCSVANACNTKYDITKCHHPDMSGRLAFSCVLCVDVWCIPSCQDVTGYLHSCPMHNILYIVSPFSTCVFFPQLTRLYDSTYTYIELSIIIIYKYLCNNHIQTSYFLVIISISLTITNSVIIHCKSRYYWTQYLRVFKFQSHHNQI